MITLMPHQLEAKRKMRNGCILRGDTGAGKTLTALAYYSDIETPERLIVVTTAKKRDDGDWEAEGRYLGIFPEVTSWQLLGAYRDVQGAFFIFDEQRIVGSGPWVKHFLQIAKNNRWILLSATPGDTWMDYIPVFIANGFYPNRTEFCREHVVFNRFARYPKVDRYIGERRLEDLLAQILVEMPFTRHTVRNEKELFCEHNRDLYDLVWRKRWNYLEERPIRNVSELFALLRRTIYTDPSRLEWIRKLLARHPRLIVFYNFDYELEILRTLDVPFAEWNGHKHEGLPSGNRWAYLVQYSAGAEAWHTGVTNAMAFYSLTYSYRMFHQAHGRIDPLDTNYTDLFYYVLRSASALDKNVAETLFRKENFNERAFLKSHVSGGTFPDV